MNTDVNEMIPTTGNDTTRSRRWFIGTAAAVGATGVLAACGSTSNASPPTTDTSETTPSSGASTTKAAASGDGAVAATAAGLEVLAVATYKGALEAATAGKLGAVPPAVATFAQTAMAHHQKALDTWNGVLKAAGAPEVTAPPASLKATVDAAFAKVTDVTGVAKLALLLEQTAADTYLNAQSVLQSKAAITTAGALQSVDQEHAAILLYVLGMYPVPLVFQTTDKAFKG